MGRPIGSGAGEATKPSNCLMSEMVAAFTLGAVHPPAGRQHLILEGPGQRPKWASQMREAQRNGRVLRRIPERVFPLGQELTRRHWPPVPQDLVQHLTSAGSFGQNPV